jgi:hypothetical protein
MKKKNIVETVPKFNRKNIERGKMDTSVIQIHDCSLSWLGTSIKRVWVNDENTGLLNNK